MSGGAGKHNLVTLIEGAHSGAYTTAGTATASKPLILDANKHVDAVRTAALYIGATGAETQMTATAAQLNFLSGVTAGTSAASKAVVLDASSKISAMDITALKIGGTTVSSTAAELNLNDGKIASATITVGTEAANVINVGIQLKDAAGADLARRGFIQAYLSDDANGDSIVATAPDAVAIGTDGLYMPLIDKKRFDLVSEADGDIDLNITKAGADTYYLILIIDDKLTASAAITFDATT